MSDFETFVPETITYSDPALEKIQYEFVAQSYYVYADGAFNAVREKIVTEPTVEQMTDSIIGHNTLLSWVEFYQRVVIQVRHPERFEGDVAGPQWLLTEEDVPTNIETVRGQKFVAAPVQLLTGFSEQTRPQFATTAEVLETGSVTPFMEAWLDRFAHDSHTYGYARHLKQLFPILDPALVSRLQKTKFPHGL
ncbi:MAG: hypothetical protein JWM81_113 [Candidatus Saccharibacteria bacterium]|nr:hypothetical protein [Candidatus Saccharibacteria bacterium]